MKAKLLYTLLLLPLLSTFSGCASDADMASRNIADAAENFEINRRVVFFNYCADELDDK